MAMLEEGLQWNGINTPELKLSIEKILALTYAWAPKFSASQAVHETSLDETTSTETVVDWYNYCWEVCADRIMNHHVGPKADLVQLLRSTSPSLAR